MAYQKLNASRAIRIVFSDTIPIPNVATETVKGSATATTSNKLVDSAKNFITLGVTAGNIIYNTTDNTAALVTAVDSATTLSVSANVFASGETYVIYREEEKNGALLFIGDLGGSSADDVKVLTAGGDEVILAGVEKGTLIPLQVKKVFATGTTIGTAYAFW